MFNNLNQKYGIGFNELLTIGSGLALLYLIFYKLSFLTVLNVEWYMALLSPQQLILSSLTLLLLGLTSAGICVFFDKFFKLTLLSEGKDLRTIFIYILIVCFVIKAFQIIGSSSVNMPIKYKSYVNYVGLNIGCISLYLFQKKAILWGKTTYTPSHKIMNFLKEKVSLLIKVLAPTMIVIAVFIAPIAVGYDYAQSIKKEMEKLLPEIKVKDSKEKWYLLEAHSTNALIITKETTNEEVKYKTRTVEMKEIESIIK